MLYNNVKSCIEIEMKNGLSEFGNRWAAYATQYVETMDARLSTWSGWTDLFRHYNIYPIGASVYILKLDW